MDHIEEFVDERHRSWCIHCTKSLGTVPTNRDHVPTKSLLNRPFPDNLSVVEICNACNNSFSDDEAYLVAFLGAVMTGSTDPGRQKNESAARLLAKFPKLRGRIDSSKSSYATRGGETRLRWTPEIERIRRVVLKNARGHAYFEFGEPMLQHPAHVRFGPVSSLTAKETDEFEGVHTGVGWPEMGSRMMTRVLTGQDLRDGWVVVQDGVYRYAIVQRGTILVRSVIWDYLVTEVFWD